MFHEMHEEEADTSTGTILEEQASSVREVGENIAPVGGNLVDVQEVPKIHLIQGLHIISSHVILVPHIEICETRSSG